MNSFEITISSIRDILRVEGITGLDSINHCIAFLISRYLTIDKCIEFEIPIEFAFENFLKNINDKSCDEQILMSNFITKNAEQDCLYVYLQDKLNFNTFKFKINSPSNFLNIYKKLENIDINILFDKIDIVGAIYELHLKTGTTGSGMRDLGQYFTNREVIKYMINLCDPKLKKNGNIETILDPSMGTGGFLSMSIKHLNKKYKNIDWDINKQNIFGFDVDESVKNMSLLNALLECGKIFNDTFIKNDSLSNGFTIIDKVDIILANEPFGLKNIVYKNTCKKIKDLKIEGTKGEPLFLQLIMQSLNNKGRCAVIVPDGVLFNESKLFKLTRKYLCDNFDLKKVISLDDGLFLNTGVKSSILYFINEEKTKEVEFCNIKMCNDLIVEEMIVKINIKNIEENDYSLFINKYNVAMEEKIKGLEYFKFGDVCDFLSKSKRNSSYGKETGKYPFYTSSETLTKYCDDFDYEKCCLIISNGGNANIKINNNFSCSADNFVVKTKNNNILIKYIYYWFVVNISKLENCFHGSVIKHLSKKDLINIEIPIPLLEMQQKIVEILDTFYDTIEGNNKLIENYKKIKNNIVWCNTINLEKEKFENLCYFMPKSKKNASYGKEIGLYPFYTSSQYLTKYCDECDYTENCLIIGTGGNPNVKINNNFSCSSDNFVIKNKNNKILNYYLYYWFENNMSKLENCFHGSTIKHLSKSDLINIQIPIPTIEIQNIIMNECLYYDELIEILNKENKKLKNNKVIETIFNSIH